MRSFKLLTIFLLLGVIVVSDPLPVKSQDTLWKVQSDTRHVQSGVGQFITCISQSAKTDTNTTDSPVRSPSPSVQNDTKLHKKCHSLRWQDSLKFPEGIEDFRVKQDTVLRQVVTPDTFLFYENDTVVKKVKLDTATTVFLNQNRSGTSVKCRDMDDEIEGSDESLKCIFYAQNGDTTRQKYFANNANGLILADTGFLVAEGGKLTLYNNENDTILWNNERIHDNLSFSVNNEFFLVSFSGFSESTNELRKLTTNEMIGSNQSLVYKQNPSPNGNLLYQVRRQSGEFKRQLSVYDRKFRQMVEWKNLPFRGNYKGRFDETREKLWIPLANGRLFEGDYVAGDSSTHHFPYKIFNAETLLLDTKNKNFFLYGSHGPLPNTPEISGKRTRVLIIFNLNSKQFEPTVFRFPHKEYDFDSLIRPELRQIGKNILAVKHPKRLEFYKYDF